MKNQSAHFQYVRNMEILLVYLSKLIHSHAVNCELWITPPGITTPTDSCSAGGIQDTNARRKLLDIQTIFVNNLTRRHPLDLPARVNP